MEFRTACRSVINCKTTQSYPSIEEIEIMYWRRKLFLEIDKAIAFTGDNPLKLPNSFYYVYLNAKLNRHN